MDLRDAEHGAPRPADGTGYEGAQRVRGTIVRMPLNPLIGRKASAPEEVAPVWPGRKKERRKIRAGAGRQPL